MKTMTIIIGMLFISHLIAGQSNYEHSGYYPVSKSGTITLKSNDAQVSISAENRQDIYIEINRKVKGGKERNFSFDIENKDGDLLIIEKNESKSWLNWNTGITIEEYTISIKTPYDVNLKITGDNDDFQINNIQGQIDIISEDGDIILNQCLSPGINMILEDGDVIINDCEAEFDLTLEDGDVAFNNCVLPSLSIRSEDGDIIMSNGTVRDCDIRMFDGDLKLSEVSGIAKIRNEDGEIRIERLMSQSADIQCEDGRIVAEIKEQEEGKYNIKTEDGDIFLTLSGIGAEIDIYHDDCDISAEIGFFEALKESENHTVYRTISGASAFVSINTDKGDIELKRFTKK